MVVASVAAAVIPLLAAAAAVSAAASQLRAIVSVCYGRCALLDLDSEIHDEIAASCMGLVFSPYSMVKGKEGGGCLYPRGRRLGSADPIRGMAEEAIRVQLEAADITGGKHQGPQLAS